MVPNWARLSFVKDLPRPVQATMPASPAPRRHVRCTRAFPSRPAGCTFGGVNPRAGPLGSLHNRVGLETAVSGDAQLIEHDAHPPRCRPDRSLRRVALLPRVHRAAEFHRRTVTSTWTCLTGAHYRDFHQIEDDEVLALLERARHEFAKRA